MNRLRSRESFTLIELLIVVAIVAILAVVVVIALNPAELLKQSRDSTRLNDMATINEAINIFQTDQGGGSLGTTSTVYVSLPDPAATSTAGTDCTSLALPTLPSGYVYHCAASSTLRSVNGTGWVPVNLSNLSSGSPLGQLPIDPVNSSSASGMYYYIYSVDSTGKWKLSSDVESQKYALRTGSDQGADPARYEIGANISLAATGPVFWLNTDSLTGLNSGDAISSWSDSSGYGNTATQGTGSAQPLYITGGQNGRPIVRFNGTTTYLIANNAATSVSGNDKPYTAFFAFKTAAQVGGDHLLSFGKSGVGTPFIELGMNNGVYTMGRRDDANTAFSITQSGHSNATFYILSVAYSGTSIAIYRNNSTLLADTSMDNATTTLNLMTVGAQSRSANGGNNYLDGDMGELLFYPYALSATERRNVETYLNSRYGAY